MTGLDLSIVGNVFASEGGKKEGGADFSPENNLSLLAHSVSLDR